MYLLINDIPIYYRIVGKGKPIVMIHGFGPDHRLMLGCMEPIFRGKYRNYKRIYFDLPGMGRTKASSSINNSDDMLNVVASFINKITANENILLAGESYGGYLSRGLIYSGKFKIDGLLLICPLIIAEKKNRNLPLFTKYDIDKELLESLSQKDRDEFESLSVIQDKYNWNRFKLEIMPALNISDPDFIEKISNNYSFSFDVDKQINKFIKPALFFLGKHDNVVGYADALNIIDNYSRSTIAILDKSGHNLQIEQPILFNALIRDWLDRVRIEE